MTDPRLAAWLDAVLDAPGMTGIQDHCEASRALLNDSLAGVPVVRSLSGPIVDVGSGGGAPGIPLAIALPDREVTLLEANERKCAFLQKATLDLPNVHVVRGRAEEQPLEVFGVAVAKALASPPVAVEWCLPLVRRGGGVVIWVGPSADRARTSRVAQQMGGELVDAAPGFIVVRKVALTPPGFPRRPGIARKRPLG